MRHIDKIITAIVDLNHIFLIITHVIHLIFQNMVSAGCQYAYLHILRLNEPLEQKITVIFSQNDFLYNKQEKLMKKYDHEIK